ncbi:MAG TPA: type IV secretion system DNA-binding domain-containing protein [Candidatus Absconditabacterales bacterium]|nr:type IV secretion system DNA-binding domain-containing protein [Candidatus Absconditabacterales bacterium]
MLKSAEKIGNKIIGNKNGYDSGESKYFFLQIKPFRDNELGVSHRDTVLRNCASLKRKKISFIICGNNTNIKFFVKLPKKFQTFFKNTFYSNFSTSDLEETEINPDLDKKKNPKKKKYIHFVSDKELNDNTFFTKDGSYMDPMREILAIFGNIATTDNLCIEFNYTFKVRRNVGEYMMHLLKIAWGSKKRNEEEEEEKINKSKELMLSVSFSISSKDKFIKESVEGNLKSAMLQFGSKPKIRNYAKYHPVYFGQAINFFHIPTKANFVKGLEYTVYRKLPYPTNIPTEGNTPGSEFTVLGKTHYRGEDLQFGIKREDKFRHYYIVGKTGTGKSTFISNMVKSDVEAGNGLCLLDPHGDLVDTVLEHIPTSRINDVILFDVSDTDYPIGFNLLQADTEDEKNRIASGVVATFHKLFEHSWGPRLEYILRNVVLSVISYPNATLMHITRILVDKDFREDVLNNLEDAVLKKFWETEFNKRSDRQRDEAIAPIVNKIGQFLSSKLVRNIFGQPRTRLNMRKAMDEGKIILVNLSKGKIGEDNATMIGSLLVTKIQIDAMSRADVSRTERKDFYLYIDEFQNFATKAFATILSEARKYRLSLIVANQFTSQLQEEVRDAIFGNVGTIMAFTLGKDDAEIISGQFKEAITTNDLISLPMFTAYLKLMVDGVSGDPFSMRTNPLPTPEGSLELIDKIRKQSRQRYAMERKELEGLMDAWSKKTFSKQEKIQEKAKLEGIGVSEDEYENSQDIFVQTNMNLFKDCSIENKEPDAIIFDTKNKRHKLCWYRKPASFKDDLEIKFKKGQVLQTPTGDRMEMFVDIYDNSDHKQYQVWIAKKEDIYKQLEIAYKNNPNMKFVPNIPELSKNIPKEEKNPVENIEEKKGVRGVFGKKKTQNSISSNGSGQFSIKDIRLGDWYEGYVKLQYNYGMFITVKGVEGLLHKNWIIAPDGVEWKKYYNIGDKIKVKAKEFKMINDEKRVVWSQK